jgi:hypothetical protein
MTTLEGKGANNPRPSPKATVVLKVFGYVSAAIAACTLMGVSTPAAATEVDTQIGQSFADGSKLFAVAKASAAGQKLAAIMIKGPDYSADLNSGQTKTVLVYFTDAAEWSKFSELWRKARGTPPPKADKVMTTSTDIGDFFDVSDKALVTVSVDSDGEIGFAMEDAGKNVQLFDMQPKSFKEFDGDVDEVTAYFK